MGDFVASYELDLPDLVSLWCIVEIHHSISHDFSSHIDHIFPSELFFVFFQLIKLDL